MSYTDFSPFREQPHSKIPLTIAAQAYLDHIRVERGLAASTVYCYASWLHHFEKWLAEAGYPDPALDAFTTVVLTRYLHHLHSKNQRPRTIRGAFYPIRGLGLFLVDQGIFTDSPAAPIGMPKKDSAIRQLVSDFEVASLIESSGRIRNPQRAAMARAIMCVFAHAGLRRTEAIGLHVSDINFEDGSLLVRRGKGSKSRRVFPHSQCMDALREWAAMRPDCDHDRLFVGGNWRPMGEKALLTLLQEVKCIAGFRNDRRICLHSIRHNCATRLLRNGADIGQIQVFLGHTSVATTQVYLHTSEEDIRDLGSKSEIERQPPRQRSKPEAIQLRINRSRRCTETKQH